MRRANGAFAHKILASGADLDGDYLLGFQRYNVFATLLPDYRPRRTLAFSAFIRTGRRANRVQRSKMRALDRIRRAGGPILARRAQAGWQRRSPVALG